MHLVLLFLFMCFLGGVGGALGSMLGNGIGKPGSLIFGGLLGGVALVVLGAFLATRWGWVRPQRRGWTMIGGVFGFVLAAAVTFATLGSPIGPVLSTLLIGTGAVLGARIGLSAHDELDA